MPKELIQCCIIRCFKVDHECVGKGIARDCEEKGGPRVLFSDHVLDFWKKIKYSPDDNFAAEVLETENEVEVQVGGTFTPKPDRAKLESRIENQLEYGAVSVKWFPKKSDHGEIKQFLVGLGLPADHDNMNIKENGQVVIGNLTSATCQQLSESITGKKFKDKKIIYCQPPHCLVSFALLV